MLLEIGFLLLALFLILGAAEFFTNGVEWLGHKLCLSEGVVGSVFAAVGTALPETLIPFVAVFFFAERHGHEVGIGAVAGAPFMLSTLTLSLCGFTVWFYGQKERRDPDLKINRTIISRDFSFFVVAYTIGIAATLAASVFALKVMIALILLGVYCLYIHQTFSYKEDLCLLPEKLHINRLTRTDSQHMALIITQIVLGLGGIVAGAFLFVSHIEKLAHGLGVPPLILSLIVAPIATELPEKINSVLWARSGKDTLALGNITGALVFQSCFPVAFGVVFTDWRLGMGTLITAVAAVLSCLAYLYLLKTNRLKPQHLMFGVFTYTAVILALYLLKAEH